MPQPNDDTGSPNASDVVGVRQGGRHEVRVDTALCKACGICISLCPKQVFDEDESGQPIVARIGDCTACRLCEWHCPDFAIEVVQAAKPKAAEPAQAAEPADEDAERVASALFSAKQRDHDHVPSDGGNHEEP
jgi:2-oxoglutarate ferredoxin oxidoreductase subunit delta